jgi:hypothetical protein
MAATGRCTLKKVWMINYGVKDDAVVLLPLKYFSDITQAFLAQLQHWHQQLVGPSCSRWQRDGYSRIG